MLTVELKRKVDRLWDAFWTEGVSNPLEIIEQITYLLFLRYFDDAAISEERKSMRNSKPLENPIYVEGTEGLRWSHFINEVPQQMFTALRDEVFPWLRSRINHESAFSRNLRDARFTIPTPGLLAAVVDVVGSISLEGSTAGDLYEYMLSKMTAAGVNGQFRTPRHIVQLMVEMIAPSSEDEICDPTCGMGGFLAASAEYVNAREETTSAEKKHARVDGSMFHGFDFDSTMLRIASMNMLLHGAKNSDIRYCDSLSDDLTVEAERYSLVLTNPPFAGSLDYEVTAKNLQEIVKTKKTELLFLALVIQLLKTGGRAAVIVPDGVLFGTSPAHKEVRRILVEDQKLEAVVKLPHGSFKPYTGVSASILFFTKTDIGRTDEVWFYEVTADGWSLDDKRVPLLSDEKLGPAPRNILDENDKTKNNLPDALARWKRRNGSERKRKRTEKSFCVAKADITAQDYDLTVNRYRQIGEAEKSAQAGGWRLGEIAEVLSGYVRSAEIDRTPSAADIVKEQRVLHPSLLTSPLPNVQDLPVRTTPHEPNYRLQQGDIVGRDLASTRYWTVLPRDYDGVQAGQGLIVIRIFRNVAPAQYLAAYLSSPQAERNFPRYGTIPRITRRGLEDIIIPECEGDFESIQSAILRLQEGVFEADRVQRVLRESQGRIFEARASHELRIRLEQASDLSSLIAQNLRKQNEPYKIFQEAYPYATARAARKFKHSMTLAEKHEAVIECAESLILSLGILSLAHAAHAGRNHLPAITQWMNSVRQGGVSLGHWVAAIRAVSADARENGDGAAGLADAMVTKKRGQGLMADLDALVAIRNKIRHGAGPRTRAELEKSLESLEKLVFNSLSSSAFLARSKWVHTDRLRWLPDIGRFQLSGLSLMGDHPDFEPIEIEVDRPLGDNSLYVFTPQGDAVPLSPYCFLIDCPTCLAPELYYPDRLTNSTALLKSLDRGHELESEEVFKRLVSLE